MADEDMTSTNVAVEDDNARLVVIIVGASGDLAKKKTYPSLLSLHRCGLLPRRLSIYGYARSYLTDRGLRDQIRPYLVDGSGSGGGGGGGANADAIEDFLSLCHYQSSGGGGYGDARGWRELDSIISTSSSRDDGDDNDDERQNRIFYLAVPPDVFAETARAIRAACTTRSGFNRLIVEKPFGKDLESCRGLLTSLGSQFDESSMYRIDHYLGKEMVQNLIVMRFGNIWMENMWNRNYVQCVVLTFKETFGTRGRGGYFDQYGIIRDIIQNHLLQGSFDRRIFSCALGNFSSLIYGFPTVHLCNTSMPFENS
jgi:glucose-6-phosphate 1-dehydrogenase